MNGGIDHSDTGGRVVQIFRGSLHHPELIWDKRVMVVCCCRGVSWRLSLSLSLSLDLPLVKLTIKIPLWVSQGQFFIFSRISAILVVILCVFLGTPIRRFGEQYGSISCR